MSSGSKLPSRVILHGVEGIGKTSFGAQAPSPVFLMARGETGLLTLIDAGQTAEVPHFPELMAWADTMSALDLLDKEGGDFKTVVLDTLNGFERLCHEHVCERDYNGDWGTRGFISYQQGYDVSLADWREFLSKLDAIRSQGKAIVCLCHTQVVSFRNPEGADYDRYAPDMHKKTWSLTHKWADMVLFANFETFVDSEKGATKGKGQGGQDRIMHTVRHAAWDAKNRHGLPEEIEMGTSGSEAWKNFRAAMKKGG